MHIYAKYLNLMCFIGDDAVIKLMHFMNYDDVPKLKYVKSLF